MSEWPRLFRALAFLVDTQLPLDSALEALSTESHARELAPVFSAVRAGTALHRALPAELPSLAREAIRAAELTGELGGAARFAADLLEWGQAPHGTPQRAAELLARSTAVGLPFPEALRHHPFTDQASRDELQATLDALEAGEVRFDLAPTLFPLPCPAVLARAVESGTFPAAVSELASALGAGRLDLPASEQSGNAFATALWCLGWALRHGLSYGEALGAVAGAPQPEELRADLELAAQLGSLAEALAQRPDRYPASLVSCVRRRAEHDGDPSRLYERLTDAVQAGVWDGLP